MDLVNYVYFFYFGMEIDIWLLFLKIRVDKAGY